MKTKLYLLFVVLGLSIFTFSSDSQNTIGIGAYTGVAVAPNINSLSDRSDYCFATGASISQGWIEEVSIGQDDFVSGSNAGYANLSTKEFIINCGSFNSFEIISGQPNGAQRHNWRVWIDYNQDGDYTNDEQVMADYNVHLSGIVFIPELVKADTKTGMRVAMNSDRIPAPCGEFQHGEVEDYTVNLVRNNKGTVLGNASANTKVKTTITDKDVIVFPNPVSIQRDISLSFPSHDIENIKISVFSIDGRLISDIDAQTQIGKNKISLKNSISNKGVYLVRLNKGNYTFLKKVTVLD